MNYKQHLGDISLKHPSLAMPDPHETESGGDSSPAQWNPGELQNNLSTGWLADKFKALTGTPTQQQPGQRRFQSSDA